tara:strand:+ start:59652 stop:59957 length:306 start_codon:yes stop_codon:yes gene_type:complete
MDLSSVSKEDLEKEIERKELAEEAQGKEYRVKTIKLVAENKDALLKLINHIRSSCNNIDNSWFHPGHGVVGCPRCYIERLDSDCLDDDVEILFDITITKVK